MLSWIASLHQTKAMAVHESEIQCGIQCSYVDEDSAGSDEVVQIINFH